MSKFQPVIKWSGSKRSQCDEIIKYFPKNINTFYEPFCGGCSVTRALIESNINVNCIICSDLNQDLINLWNFIKNDPKLVIDSYEFMWNELNKDNNINRKIEYYNNVRREYNITHDPLLFMFIMRTAINGMPRYNSKGEFNSPFHINRNGIMPNKLSKIVTEWSSLLNNRNVLFKSCSYLDIEPLDSDFIYFDPPYENTKGMYYGHFIKNDFFEYLSKLQCHYAMSYDGIVDDKNQVSKVPSSLYNKHVLIKSGNSSFRRLIGTSNKSVVYESLYIR